jgi:hypothetical protein
LNGRNSRIFGVRDRLVSNLRRFFFGPTENSGDGASDSRNNRTEYFCKSTENFTEETSALFRHFLY